MNYKSELRRLERLLRADHEAYLDELDRPWDGMDEDLDLATKILLKHAARSGGQLSLIEAFHLPEDPREEATVTLPGWWVEIITTFRELSLCCTGRRCGRIEPYPCPGSRGADVLRASQVQHAVQGVDGDGHLGRLSSVRLEA